MADTPARIRPRSGALGSVAVLLLTLAGAAVSSAEPPGVPVAVGGSILRTAGDTSNERLVFPSLPSGVTYTAVEAGAAHSLALRSDGKVDSAGYNFWGQRDLPGLVDKRYTAVSAGGEHTLALVSDGSVVGVGRNSEGQAVIPPPGPGRTYTAVAAGAFHSLVLRSDGTAQGYGLNADGQAEPPDLSLLPGVTYTAIAAGDHHSLALRSDGDIVAFGANGSGQREVPALPPGLSYRAVSAGDAWSLALRSDGRLAAWGADVFGVVSALPLPVAGTRFTAISAGGQFGIALRSDGLVVHWGKSDIGQGALPAPSPGSRYVAIGAGGAHSLGVVRVEPPADVTPALTLRVRPKRDRVAPYRYRLTGHLQGAFAVTPDVCGGVVAVKLKQGGRVVARRSSSVNGQCTWTATLKAGKHRLRGSGPTTLRLKVRFHGHVSTTTVLQPATTKTKVRAR